MEDKLMLMIPGPTPVPEQVLLAMAKHPIGHRSADFGKIMAEVTQNLKWLHQTQNDLLILTASGTGAMEAGIINFLSPGDRVLVGSNGKFGERWAEVTDAYGLQTERITAEWGKPLDPEQFREKLEADTQKPSRPSSSLTAKLQRELSTICKRSTAMSKPTVKR